MYQKQKNGYLREMARDIKGTTTWKTVSNPRFYVPLLTVGAIAGMALLEGCLEPEKGEVVYQNATDIVNRIVHFANDTYVAYPQQGQGFYLPTSEGWTDKGQVAYDRILQILNQTGLSVENLMLRPDQVGNQSIHLGAPTKDPLDVAATIQRMRDAGIAARGPLADYLNNASLSFHGSVDGTEYAKYVSSPLKV